MSYHLNATVVSRGQGHSLMAKAAYNGRDKFVEQRTGDIKDYTRMHDRPVASFVFVNSKAPEELHRPDGLCNALDAFDKRRDAQLAYSMIVSLPHELTDQQREFIVKDFCREEFLRKGAAAIVNIHRPHEQGDQRNDHAHILISMREVGDDGVGKRRVFTFERKEEQLQRWREKWAERTARELDKAGLTVTANRWRYGHLTNEKQAEKARANGDHEWAAEKQLEASKHLGPDVAAQERRGIETERGQQHTATSEENKLRDELRDVEKQIAAEVEKQIDEQQKTDKDRTNTAAPPLGKTAGEIRMAYSLTATGQEFVNALEDRGLIVAVATAVDIEIEAVRTGATEKWQRLREDEIIVINRYGDLYRLTERNTGDNRREREEHLKDVDRASLLTVTQARTVAGDLRRHHDDERELREAQSEIRFFGARERNGPQNDDRQREVRDRAERMSMVNELASVAEESQETVLDWVERRTIANEKAAARERTRDS